MATRVIYMSTPEFGIPTLRALHADDRFELVGVITQPDRPAGRGLKLTPPPIKREASRLGVRLLQPSSLRAAEVLDAVQDLRPDVIAVAAYGQWIPIELFNLPPKRSVNLHPSLLPLHRGAAPVVSALLAGDDEVGLTALFVEDEMDSGDILGQMRVPVRPQDTTASLMTRLAELGAPFFVNTLADWVEGRINPVPQDHSRATWIDRMTKDAGLIDWSLPASDIARRCRAYAPWPGTFTYYRGSRLLIHEAEAIPLLGEAREAGTVMRVGKAIAVVCGDGGLQLGRVQLAGRRMMAVEHFLRGQRDFVGARLG